MYLSSTETDKIDKLEQLIQDHHLMVVQHYHPVDMVVGVPPLTMRIPITTGARVVGAGLALIGTLGFGALLVSKLWKNAKR